MLYSIFAPFYYKSKFEGHDDVKSLLLDHIVEQYQKNPSNQPKKWTCNVHTSHGTYDEKLFSVKNTYEKGIIPFFEEIKMPSVEADISELWFNAYGKGQWQENHHHHGVSQDLYFSAVHFLKYDKSIHPPLVMNNMNRILVTPYSVGRKTRLDYWNVDEAIDVEEGDLLIFPTFMEHQVNIQETEELRITVSFNIEVKLHNDMNLQKINQKLQDNHEDFYSQHLEQFISSIPGMLQ
jgi:hypothetical protein